VIYHEPWYKEAGIEHDLQRAFSEWERDPWNTSLIGRMRVLEERYPETVRDVFLRNDRGGKALRRAIAKGNVKPLANYFRRKRELDTYKRWPSITDYPGDPKDTEPQELTDLYRLWVSLMGFEEGPLFSRIESLAPQALFILEAWEKSKEVREG